MDGNAKSNGPFEEESGIVLIELHKQASAVKASNQGAEQTVAMTAELIFSGVGQLRVGPLPAPCSSRPTTPTRLPVGAFVPDCTR